MILTIISLYLLSFQLCHALLRLRIGHKMAIMLALFLGTAIFLPIAKLPVYQYMMSLTSYLSISSFVILLIGFIRQISLAFSIKSSYPSLQEQRFLYRILAYTGLIFYPMTLGLTQFDPYILGYWQSFPANYYTIVSLLALISIVCCYLQYYYLPIIFILSLISYKLTVYPSANWWDTCIDPWIWGYACYWLAKNSITALRKAHNQNQHQPTKSIF